MRTSCLGFCRVLFLSALIRRPLFSPHDRSTPTPFTSRAFSRPPHTASAKNKQAARVGGFANRPSPQSVATTLLRSIPRLYRECPEKANATQRRPLCNHQHKGVLFATIFLSGPATHAHGLSLAHLHCRGCSHMFVVGSAVAFRVFERRFYYGMTMSVPSSWRWPRRLWLSS
jgi:hypothetical protein